MAIMTNSVQTDDSYKKEGHCTVTVNDKTLKLKMDTGPNVMSFPLTHEVTKHSEKLYKQVKLVAFGEPAISSCNF